MLQINVNGASREGQSRPENWGELLGLLEQGDGLSRHIVTAVRFGGVAVPTFRDPSELARELQDVDRIDVETATLDELLHESAQAAYDSLVPLRKAVGRIAARLRAGHARAAVRDLPALTGSVQTLSVTPNWRLRANASVRIVRISTRSSRGSAASSTASSTGRPARSGRAWRTFSTWN